MTEPKKLTGREAVIALMEGKHIRRPIGMGYENALCAIGHKPCFSLNPILEHNDWEIVPEPAVWEYEGYALHVKVSGYPFQMPNEFYGKRVKVRVEEIL